MLVSDTPSFSRTLNIHASCKQKSIKGNHSPFINKVSKAIMKWPELCKNLKMHTNTVFSINMSVQMLRKTPK